MRQICLAFGLDRDRESTQSTALRRFGQFLVNSMKKALEAGGKHAAQHLAAECADQAESRNHANWELLGEALNEMQHAAHAPQLVPQTSRAQGGGRSLSRKDGPWFPQVRTAGMQSLLWWSARS